MTVSEVFEIDLQYVIFYVSTTVNNSFIMQFSRLVRNIRSKWPTSPSNMKVQEPVSFKSPALPVHQVSFQGMQYLGFLLSESSD